MELQYHDDYGWLPTLKLNNGWHILEQYTGISSNIGQDPGISTSGSYVTLPFLDGVRKNNRGVFACPAAEDSAPPNGLYAMTIGNNYNYLENVPRAKNLMRTLMYKNPSRLSMHGDTCYVPGTNYIGFIWHNGYASGACSGEGPSFRHMYKANVAYVDLHVSSQKRGSFALWRFSPFWLDERNDFPAAASGLWQDDD